jgi:hypothetical protein
MFVSVSHAVLACLLSATPGDLRVNASLLLPTEGTLPRIHCMPGHWIGSAGPEQWVQSHIAQSVHSRIGAAVIPALPLIMHCS